MTTPRLGRAYLLALLQGFPPHARAFVREDFAGPYAALSCDSLRSPQEESSLWESAQTLAPAALARSIRAGEAAPLAVPAPTCLCGECTSTFAVAWSLLERDLFPEWGAVLASCQTEGRGQLRRAWYSPRGNLYATFRLPKDAIFCGDAASVVIGGLLARSFAALGIPLLLKWPNDLLSPENAKAGGMLLEEKDGIVLAGLGVNLAGAPPDAALRVDRAIPATVLPPHSLQKFPSPFTLWQHLVSEAILEYTAAFAGQTLPSVFSRFEPLLAWKGRQVRLTEPDGSFVTGRCQGISERGEVLLRHADGDARGYWFGSLSLADTAGFF